MAHTLSAVQVLDDKAAEQEILVQARIVAEEKAKADLAAQQLRDREAARHADMHDHHELFVGESARQAKLIQPIPDHVKNNGGACSHRLHPSQDACCSPALFSCSLSRRAWMPAGQMNTEPLYEGLLQTVIDRNVGVEPQSSNSQVSDEDELAPTHPAQDPRQDPTRVGIWCVAPITKETTAKKFTGTECKDVTEKEFKDRKALVRDPALAPGPRVHLAYIEPLPVGRSRTRSSRRRRSWVTTARRATSLSLTPAATSIATRATATRQTPRNRTKSGTTTRYAVRTASVRYSV